MSRVPQAKGGAKSNLAKALAAGFRVARGTSGRTKDKVRSPSTRSPRRAVPLHAAGKRDTVLSRAVGRSPRRGRGSVRQRPRRTPQPRAGSVIPTGWRLSTRLWQRKLLEHRCARCCGCWSLQQMDRQLGQRCPPSLLEGRRQANVYCARIPRKDLAAVE